MDAAYLRKEKVIYHVSTKQRDHYPSINQAKRVSAELQRKHNGRIGNGILKVVTKLPAEDS